MTRSKVVPLDDAEGVNGDSCRYTVAARNHSWCFLQSSKENVHGETDVNATRECCTIQSVRETSQLSCAKESETGVNL